MSEPLITVDLPAAYGGPLEFQSIEEIDALLKTESDSWSFIQDLQRTDTNNREAWKELYNEMARAWQIVRDAVAAHKGAPPESAAGTRQRLQAALLHFGPKPSPRALLSFSALGQAVRSESQPRKLYALMYILQDKLPGDLTLAKVQTWLKIYLIIQGVVEALVPTELALRELTSRVNTELASQKAGANEHLAAMKTLHDTSKSELEQSRSRLASFLEEQERRVRESLHVLTGDLVQLKSELEKTENLYSTKLALSAPVAYWTKEHERNRNMASGWMAATLVVLGLVGITLMVVVYSLWDLKQSEVSWLLSGVTLAALALMLGTVRFLSKLWLSSQNLETAYAEKMAITQTFLALLNEGKLKDEDRTIALATIFRSAVVDEREGLSATTTAEALLKAFSGR